MTVLRWALAMTVAAYAVVLGLVWVFVVEMGVTDR